MFKYWTQNNLPCVGKQQNEVKDEMLKSGAWEA
jgi:hypothetical protein